MSGDKSFAFVDRGAIRAEWRNPAEPFVVGDMRYHPGGSADETWFQDHDVFIVTTTRPDYDPAIEELQGPVDTIDHAAKTIARVCTVRALTTQEKNNAAGRDLEGDGNLTAAVEAICEVAGLDRAVVMTAFNKHRRRLKEAPPPRQARK